MNLEWMDRAKCRDYSTSLFYNEQVGLAGKAANDAAKAICRQCPVLKECDEWATETDEPHGIWAAKVRKGKAKTAVQCGTESGAQTHRRRHEKVCEPCERAERVAWRERRIARRSA